MHPDFAVILAFFAIVVPWLGRRRIRQLMQMPQTTKADRLTLYASTFAFQWIAVGVILWRTKVHHITPDDLGLAIPELGKIALISIVLAAAVFANQIVSLRRLATRPDEVRGPIPQLAMKIFPQDNMERLVFFALAATVAICEEIIYRGFVQRVLQDWAIGYLVAGILGSALLFALAHLYQGPRGLFSTFVIGLLFSVVRAWTGSIVPPLIAHFVADFTAGLLAPGRIKSALDSIAKEDAISAVSSDSVTKFQ